MAKTFKDLFGGGYTTHGDDGTTYKTTKDLIGDGYTTHGSDGSTYKTNKNLLDNGYTTSKISGGNEGELGSGIAVFAAVFIILLCCTNVLTIKSYVCVAGLLIAPKLSGICERLHISSMWCSGVLFCFASFSAINSFDNDISKHRGGSGLITQIVLFVILCVGLMFAIYGITESRVGFLSFFVLMISLAWCYFNMYASIPYTHQMTHYALGLLFMFAIIDQIKLLRKK